MKIDLHVHSAFSKRPANWLLQKIGTAESYTSPAELYRIARERGMNAVTITDHNAIDGCLEIAHLPNTFISCEVTTYFPEDHCKVHVLVYNITEGQFAQIDKARENIYDFVSYLRENNIPHALAHPFYNVNDRLTVEHFEKSILLFDIFELNGDQDKQVNQILQELLTQVTEADMEELRNRYNLEPAGEESWLKGFVGGSDDHSSLNIARTCTECAEASTLATFWEEIANKKSTVKFFKPSTPKTMAHEIYGVAYQFYNSKFQISRYRNHNMLVCFLDRILQSKERKANGLIQRLRFRWSWKANSQPDLKKLGVSQLFQHEAQRYILEDSQLTDVLNSDNRNSLDDDGHWFRFVNRISNQALAHLGGRLLDNMQSANPFDIFHIIGSVGALYMLIAPYFVSYSIYSNTRRFAWNAYHARCKSPKRRKPNVAFFTDTFNEVNGVALTLQKNIEMAQKLGKDMQILTCTKKDGPQLDHPSVRYFDPVHEHDLPEYPEMKIFIPPLLEMMAWCYENDFTHIHSVTPGPVGLCGLIVARLMNLPLITTYHTAMPQYTGCLTGDKTMEDLMWRLMVWFYNQADLVFSPSKFMSDELIEKGVDSEKIHLMPRGVNLDDFHPKKQTRKLKLPKGTKFIYVGRVSREKNLDLLAKAFKQLSKTHPQAVLVVVGDGPYLEQMKQEMKDDNCVFTGYLEGDDLVGAYTACDVFVFPSTTDTFGNVVLEAQACGLPIIVTDMGGPQENLIPGKTGVIVKGNDEASLIEAMRLYLDHPEKCKVMGQNAREYAATRDYEQAFLRYFKYYQESCASSTKSFHQDILTMFPQGFNPAGEAKV